MIVTICIFGLVAGFALMLDDPYPAILSFLIYACLVLTKIADTLDKIARANEK